MSRIKNQKSHVNLEKTFWLIIGLSGIIVGTGAAMFYQSNNDTPLIIVYFFSICAIMLGIFFLLYSLRLQPIEVRDNGITLRQRGIKDFFLRKETILFYNRIEKIEVEGNIINISIKNKRIPFKVPAEHICSYEELIKKFQNKNQTTSFK